MFNGRGQEDKSAFCVELVGTRCSCVLLFRQTLCGSRHDLLKVAVNMKNADPQSETAKAIQEYFGGNHGATHKIAYQEIAILTPVRVLTSSKMTL